jgi:hypothetical protein
MKTLSLLLGLCLPLGGGEGDKALELYQQGKFREAAAAFRAAIAAEGDTPELEFNLALSLWRAGDLAGAEQAAEKYAATAGAPRDDLHYGLLGAVRYDEAKAGEAAAEQAGAAPPPTPAPTPGNGGKPPSPPPDPLPMLEQALVKAEQARDHFVRGATMAGAAPEVQRNVERSLRLVDDLQKKIEELKKQREQQKKDDNKKDDKKKDDKKDDKKDKPDDSKKDENKDDKQDKPQDKDKPEQKPTDAPKPQDQPEPDQAQEPKPSGKDEKDKGKPEPERHDAPGEQAEGKQLSPEQTQKLQELLAKMDEALKDYRARLRASKKKGAEKDW